MDRAQDDLPLGISPDSGIVGRINLRDLLPVRSFGSIEACGPDIDIALQQIKGRNRRRAVRDAAMRFSRALPDV
jgi:hypothetical protein